MAVVLVAAGLAVSACGFGRTEAPILMEVAPTAPAAPILAEPAPAF